MRLNLIVLRARDPKGLARFYEGLGMSFMEEKHGNGPVHFSADLSGTILEIYPATGDASGVTDIRLGFVVSNLSELMEHIADFGARILTPPGQTPWGYRAVIKDIEGHTVELTEVRKKN
ncbi:MAG: VOC family protein [Asticcacaulis sp.]